LGRGATTGPISFKIPKERCQTCADARRLWQDPTRLEESVINGRIVVTAGRREHSVVYGIQVCHVALFVLALLVLRCSRNSSRGAGQKYGGAAVPSALMTRCCAQAVERAAELDHVVRLLCVCARVVVGEAAGRRSAWPCGRGIEASLSLCRCLQEWSCSGMRGRPAVWPSCFLTLSCQRAMRWEIIAAGGVEAQRRAAAHGSPTGVSCSSQT
jgi:hypothetical protein